MRRRALALLLLAAGVALLAGCGLGPGKGASNVELTVTRDFGARTVGSYRADKVPGSETVLRMLERHFKITTRYGGGFVQSINGLAGGQSGGRPVDWFFYVNGVESPRGGAEVSVHAGDRIWWDRHDWGGAMHIPAVVGSFPEPFVHGAEEKRAPVTLGCAPGADTACSIVQKRLLDAGVPAAQQAQATAGGKDTIRVLIGPYSALQPDAAAGSIAQGPKTSGVFARIAGRSLVLLRADGSLARRLGPGAGLIAATRFQDQEPTWLVTGVDEAGAEAAAGALRPEELANRFAVAVTDSGEVLAVPRP